MYAPFSCISQVAMATLMIGARYILGARYLSKNMVILHITPVWEKKSTN
jgi:hypothetical protein